MLRGNDTRVFRYWCYKVLPLVYDDSLSYYEVLCKVVDYINKMIEEDKSYVEDIEELKAEMEEVQTWIDNFDTSFIEELVQEYIGKVIKNVVFGISTAGYFMAMIPDNWSDLQFGTVQSGELYGHLTLQYD